MQVLCWEVLFEGGSGALSQAREESRRRFERGVRAVRSCAACWQHTAARKNG